MPRSPAGRRPYEPVRRSWLLLSILPILLSPACAATKAAGDRPPPTFDRRAVALIAATTSDEAERQRQRLLEGEPLPSGATIIPLSELDQIDPALSTQAARLAPCEVSRPAESPAAPEGGYVVMQRGTDPASSCVETPPTLSERLKQIDEKGGELLIGLLMIGLVGFFAAVPFIFGIF